MSFYERRVIIVKFAPFILSLFENPQSDIHVNIADRHDIYRHPSVVGA